MRSRLNSPATGDGKFVPPGVETTLTGSVAENTYWLSILG
jgi:hypothetical protein